MKIYFIRHTAVDVPAGYAYGQTDVNTKASFTEEAQCVKRKIETIQFDQVWSSPLSRCSKLASFCGFPNAIKESRIMEINFGEWEMKTWEEISADPRSEKWFNDWVNTPIPQGESLQNQYDRVKDFLDTIRGEKYNNVCLFTHGGVLACARVYIGEISLKEALNKVPPYGTVMPIEFP